jgi:cell division protein FtsB
MITVKQHEKLIDKISGLSEIELDQLLKDVGEHLRKNNLEHLIDNAFQMDDQTDEIEGLEQRVSELESEIDTLESDSRDLQTKIDGAIEKLEELEGEEFGEDWGREKIEETIKLLQ